MSGIDALLYPGFTLGMHGAISALTSAVPGAVVRLHKMVKEGEHEHARRLHFQLNRLWNAIPPELLPACVKYVQHLQGVPLYYPRAPMYLPQGAVKDELEAALEPIVEEIGEYV